MRAECERLADAIGRGGPLDALLERLRARQARRQELEGQFAEHADVRHANGRRRPRAAAPSEARRLARAADAERRERPRRAAGAARRTAAVHAGDRSAARGYAFEGAIALDRLVSGVIELPTADWRGVPGGIRKYVEAEIGRDYAETTSLVAPTDGVTTALPCRDSRTPLSPTFPSISYVRGNPTPPQRPLPIVLDLSR